MLNTNESLTVILKMPSDRQRLRLYLSIVLVSSNLACQGIIFMFTHMSLNLGFSILIYRKSNSSVFKRFP